MNECEKESLLIVLEKNSNIEYKYILDKYKYINYIQQHWI